MTPWAGAISSVERPLPTQDITITEGMGKDFRAPSGIGTQDPSVLLSRKLFVP